MLVDESALVSCVIFFFKQKTAYEMRISDWISDVCSSDLLSGKGRAPRQCAGVGSETPAPDADTLGAGCTFSPISRTVSDGASPTTVMWTEQIGRASCKERECKYV